MKPTSGKIVYDAQKSQQNFIGRIKSALLDLKPETPSERSIIDDMTYYLDHYDFTTGLSHQRAEMWGLGWAVLKMLDFNLSAMAKKIEVVPERLKRCAERELAAKIRGESPKSAERRVFARARQLWATELAQLSGVVAAYRYYAEAGVLKREREENVPSGAVPWETLSERELKKMRAKSWRALVALYGKCGQDLWN